MRLSRRIEVRIIIAMILYIVMVRLHVFRKYHMLQQINHNDIGNFTAKVFRLPALENIKTDISDVTANVSTLPALENIKHDIGNFIANDSRFPALENDKYSIGNFNTNVSRLPALENTKTDIGDLNANVSRLPALENIKHDIGNFTANVSRLPALENTKTDIGNFTANVSRLPALENTKTDIGDLIANVSRLPAFKNTKTDIGNFTANVSRLPALENAKYGSEIVHADLGHTSDHLSEANSSTFGYDSKAQRQVDIEATFLVNDSVIVNLDSSRWDEDDPNFTSMNEVWSSTAHSILIQCGNDITGMFHRQPLRELFKDSKSLVIGNMDLNITNYAVFGVGLDRFDTRWVLPYVLLPPLSVLAWTRIGYGNCCDNHRHPG